MVKCCGFVEFWRELGKKTQKMEICKKKLVQNAEFFIIWRFPFPDAAILAVVKKYT
jgi:hypothetical protein